MRIESNLPGQKVRGTDWSALISEADGALTDSESWALIVEGRKDRSEAARLRIRYPSFEIVTRTNYTAGGFDFWVRRKAVS